jgi:hypothetical protein
MSDNLCFTWCFLRRAHGMPIDTHMFTYVCQRAYCVLAQGASLGAYSVAVLFCACHVKGRHVFRGCVSLFSYTRRALRGRVSLFLHQKLNYCQIQYSVHQKLNTRLQKLHTL